ncbi:hypothetical protein OAA15_00260 [bacterium]|nr:hypothetical protein [bacterium]
MAVNLKNYYDSILENTQSSLGVPSIPNPNDPNNNNASTYAIAGGTLTNNPAPLLTFPIGTGKTGPHEGGILSTLATGLNNVPDILDDTLGGVFGELSAGAVDVERIKRFLYETPEGIAFNLRQVGLQAMSSKIPHGGIQGGSNFLGKLVNDNRIYNMGGNLLAQVGAEAIDVHLNRHGIVTAAAEYPNNKGVYSEYYADNEEKSDSSLINLRNKFMIQSSTPTNSVINQAAGLLGNVNTSINNLFGNKEELFSYGGGPKSILGIGRTSHKRYQATDSDPLGNAGWNGRSSGAVGQAVNNMLANSLAGTTTGNIAGVSNLGFDLDPTVNDATTVLPIISTTALRGLPQTLDELDTLKLSIEQRSGIGRAGSRTETQRKDLTSKNITTQDKINKISLLKGSNTDLDSFFDLNTNTNTQESDLAKDLVKFRFEAIDNDNVDEFTLIIFRAFLKGISDSFTGNWNGAQYVGRGEKFHTYQGFDRAISFNFDVSPQSRDEVKPLIQKLNFLSSNIAPDYNSAGRMRGSFMRLTIGDYFSRLPGFISSLNYTISDEAPWDIALYKDSSYGSSRSRKDFVENERQLPHLINVSVSFTPIHDFLAKKGNNDVFYMLEKGDKWITDMADHKQKIKDLSLTDETLEPLTAIPATSINSPGTPQDGLLPLNDVPSITGGVPLNNNGPLAF